MFKLLLVALSLVAASLFPSMSNAAKQASKAQQLTISQTVIKKPLQKGVSFDDAITSMKLRANALNFKLVAELPLSKQIEAMTDKPQRRMEIYQFCDALIAKTMVDHDLNFAAYLPCRIAIIEDAKGQTWLVMMNIDLFLQSANLPSGIKAQGIQVRDTLQSIMDAGAAGDL